MITDNRERDEKAILGLALEIEARTAGLWKLELEVSKLRYRYTDALREFKATYGDKPQCEKE